MNGTRYLESNPKVYDFVACRRVGTAISKKAFRFSIATTAAFAIVEGVLDKQTLGQIGISVTVDVAVAAVGAAGGAVATVGTTTLLGTTICPVIGTGVGLVVGIAVTVAGNAIVSHYDVKGILYDAVQKCEDKILNIKTNDGWTQGEIITGEPLKAWLIDLSDPEGI